MRYGDLFIQLWNFPRLPPKGHLLLGIPGGIILAKSKPGPVLLLLGKKWSLKVSQPLFLISLIRTGKLWCLVSSCTVLRNWICWKIIKMVLPCRLKIFFKYINCSYSISYHKSQIRCTKGIYKRFPLCMIAVHIIIRTLTSVCSYVFAKIKADPRQKMCWSSGFISM